MFTGLTQAIGHILAIEPHGDDTRFHVHAGDLAPSHLTLGASIACNGVCLTVITFDATSFWVDVSAETLKLTTLGCWQVGTRINLEPCLTLQTPLGGHLVSGHVDGVGTVLSRTTEARSTRFDIALSLELGRFIAMKGSVTVEGVSLTVNKVRDENDMTVFDINLIPHTLSHTTLGDLQAGSRVNIEVDLLARYAARLSAHQP